MFKTLCQRAGGLASDFLSVQKGSILIYTGAFMSIGVGSAALSIDIGNIVLLRTQMQNRADAGALAGAAQLDAQDGAVKRADTVVRESMSAFTTSNADSTELPVLDVTIHEAEDDGITRKAAVTTDDGLARFVVVILERRTLSFFYGPAAAVLAGKTTSSTVELDAYAIGMSDPYICKAQPLMICDPFDNSDGTSYEEVTDDANIGRMITLKPPSTNANDLIGGGNFGLLALPEDSYGNSGASSIEKAMSDQEPLGCYAISSITTASGNKVTKVADGVNTRFGVATQYMPDPKPAPNVINYPKDADVAGLSEPPLMGNGSWGFSTYWGAKHSGQPEPATVSGSNFPAIPSRYQVYLFELDVTFYTKGNKTTSTKFEDPGQGWKEVDPNVLLPAAAVVPEKIADPTNRWEDGKFDNGSVSDLGQARRLLRLALVRCKSVDGGLNGRTTLTNPERYVELFLTQEVVPPNGTDLGDGTSGQGAIYAEIVRKLEPQTSLEFHGNVRLVE